MMGSFFRFHLFQKSASYYFDNSFFKDRNLETTDTYIYTQRKRFEENKIEGSKTGYQTQVALYECEVVFVDVVRKKKK